METDDGAWWRCAYFAYLDSGLPLDHQDEDEATGRAIASLQDTVSGFLDGALNFGTLKYRMDVASAESQYTFPARTVSSTLSDIALGVPLDDLEPALRRAAVLPDGPGMAKGALMDLEEVLERAVARGTLERSLARPERWAELLACLWHIQDPGWWPLVSDQAIDYLRSRGDISRSEPAQDYAEYVIAARRLAEILGADLAALDHLLSSLGRDEIAVPGTDACFQDSMARAEGFAAEGDTDRALESYERALALRPQTPAALRRKAELYAEKGLNMAAIGELEVLVGMEPGDLEAHRTLVSLYRSQNMVREHNVEVRRWKTLKEARLSPPGN